MSIYIPAGVGFTVPPYDFYRVPADTPVELAPAEYAKPGDVIGYIAGDPGAQLGFLRRPRVRVVLRKSLLVERD